MHLTTEDLKLLAEKALEAAKIAAEYIQRERHSIPSVQIKEGVSSRAAEVVTAIDVHSQELILANLQPLTDQFDLGVLTEEATDDGSRFEKDYFWCIDPLDGTLAYIEGGFGYSVSIALVSKEGVPVIGLVIDPDTGRVYQATVGQGIKFPGKMGESDHLLHCYFDRSMEDHPMYEQVLDGLEEVAENEGLTGPGLNSYNGAVMNACDVLQHKHAVYFKLPKKEPGGGSFWDFAATACLFKEARKLATDCDGEPLRFNDRQSTFMNKKGVIYASNERISKQVIALCEQLEKRVK